MSVRDSFVARFGEDEAQRFEAAANQHGNGLNYARKGSDPFKWVVAIVIGYQCAEVEGYRGIHGITSSWDEVKDWIKTDANLASHDGDVDYLSVFAGVYNEYVGKEAPQ